jgi:hypothetical protein
MLMRPEVGASRPAMRPSSVDLPLPEGHELPVRDDQVERVEYR